jgi:transposase
MNVFAARTAELAEARPELAAAVEPLLKAREAVGRQIADLDRKVMRLARNDAQVSLHVRSLLPRGHACDLTALEFE